MRLAVSGLVMRRLDFTRGSLQSCIYAIVCLLHHSHSVVRIDDQRSLHENLGQIHFIRHFFYCRFEAVKWPYFGTWGEGSA